VQNNQSVCYNVVNETYVPSSLKISDTVTMAPMQRPYVVQAVLEAGVKAKLAQVLTVSMCIVTICNALTAGSCSAVTTASTAASASIAEMTDV
jgi:hypothetical protein